MERYPTDSQFDVIVVSADEVEEIARAAVSEHLYELLAEILDQVEPVRRQSETDEQDKEEARNSFPGLPHDIALRPRPVAYTPMRRKKRHRKWRIRICTGNLQLLPPLAA